MTALCGIYIKFTQVLFCSANSVYLLLKSILSNIRMNSKWSSFGFNGKMLLLLLLISCI